MGLDRFSPVKVAVIPVAGYGTRMLPASKAIPKEMLPVLDKPMIQLVAEEASRAGIEHIVFVTLPGKTAIENHFDANVELEDHLKRHGKSALLASVQGVLPDRVSFCSVRQGGVFGLGHAIYSARNVVGDRSFAVLLPDVLVDCRNDQEDLARMIDQHSRTGSSQVLVERVERDKVSDYGIVALDDNAGFDVSQRMSGIVEKPDLETAPSELAVVGRYVFSPSIFQALARVSPGHGGEIQLTDGIARELNEREVYACLAKGETFDCGSKLGWLRANIHYAIQQAEHKDKVTGFLKAVIEAAHES